MREKEVNTAPRVTPLGVLQTNPLHTNGPQLYYAAQDIAAHHPPVSDQAYRHGELADALANFLHVIAVKTPPGPERSTAISRAREAKFWASAAIALEEVNS